MAALIRIVRGEQAARKDRSPQSALPSLRKWFVILGCTLLLNSTHALAGTARSVAQRTASAEMRANCEICHDRGMLAQQRLTPAQWQAEVEKMRNWGAPLPPDQEKSLVDYLSSQFPVGAVPMAAPESPSVTLSDSVKPLADPAGFHGDARVGQGLYTDACAECHGADARGKQGPNLVQQPILYRFNDFQEIVMRGRRTMPAYSGVLDRKQLEDLVAWLRTLQVTQASGVGRAEAHCTLVAALPLLRLAAATTADVDLDAAHSLATQTLYLSQCARCHGRSGHGDGPEAPQLRMQLHSFSDCGWMLMMSDATLFLIIKDGAAAAGFPAGMPGFGGTLGYDQMVALLHYVRGFCAGQTNGQNVFAKPEPNRRRRWCGMFGAIALGELMRA